MARVCIVTQSHSTPGSTGGAEFQIDCLIAALRATRRHDISYVAHIVPPDVRPEGYPLVKIGTSSLVERFGYWIHALPLYRALSSIRPDVVYQRVACGYTGIAAYYARRNRARLVWHVAHDADVMPRNTLLYGRNVVQQFIERRCIDYGIRHASNIVVQSERQAEYLTQYYGRKPDALVPNFHPEPSETVSKKGPLCVLWVANLKPWKRPEIFVRLAARLRELSDVRFTMVGALGGSKSWREALLRDIEKTTNLDYVGAKSQGEVNALLARAHVFVNTSVEEGYPNTFIQAWLREVPVVSLTVNPDGVLDRQSVGIHAGSEQNLEEAVRRLISDPALREELGVRAREYARQRHSLRNVNGLIRLIETGRVDS